VYVFCVATTQKTWETCWKHEKHDYLATFGLFSETFLAVEQQQPSNLQKHKKPDHIWEKNLFKDSNFFLCFLVSKLSGCWNLETCQNIWKHGNIYSCFTDVPPVSKIHVTQEESETSPFSLDSSQKNYPARENWPTATCWTKAEQQSADVSCDAAGAPVIPIHEKLLSKAR